LGAFRAAIFERETGRLFVPGVNLLMSLDCSVFHAEMAAIILAQQIIGDFDLGRPGRPPYELVASTEPCAMCLDATRWFGVRHPVRGARDGDAERLGFDEGTKPAEWVPALERRGITWSATYYATRPPRCFGNLPGAEGEVYDAR
jgi:tRNA(Arg) A34 adenosine deaminase TadA